MTDITIKNYSELIQLTKLVPNLIIMVSLVMELASCSIIVSLVAQFVELKNVTCVRMSFMEGKLVKNTDKKKKGKKA